MSVTGQFKSGRISIPRVTGDIVITVTATNDTSPEIEMVSAKYTTSPTWITNLDNTPDSCISKLVATDSYTGTKTYKAHIPYTSTVVYLVGADDNGYTCAVNIGNVASDSSFDTVKSANLGSSSVTVNKVGATFSAASIDNSFLYRDDTGQVIFAGKNTPYYGKKYITD